MLGHSSRTSRLIRFERVSEIAQVFGLSNCVVLSPEEEPFAQEPGLGLNGGD